MYKKIALFSGSVVTMLSIVALPAFAHVIVHPNQVGIAATQVFYMSVPTEKDNPTVGIKLLIPDGVTDVMPNVKSGWTITTKKNGDNVTEIDWTSGSIPPEERDDFYFQAQVPAKEATLNWKAYQTYQDGSTVAWDHDPKLSKGPDDDSAPPPYSQTKVVNDLKTSSSDTMTMGTAAKSSSSSSDKTALVFSVVALALSAAAIGKGVLKR